MLSALGFLLACILVVVVLEAVVPLVVAFAHAFVPLVLAVGVVAILMRLAWWLTGRW
jgi:hypothetical protein